MKKTKSKSKSMSGKQILAIIGLVIAILWTLKFVFELSSSGVKEVSKKISKSSGLPILECIIDNPNGTKTTQIYDLEEIQRLAPTEQLEGESTTLRVQENEYTIYFNNIQNGIQKGYFVFINRDTGVFEGTIPEPYRLDTPWADMLEIMSRAKSFTGVCKKKAKKNL